MPPVAICSQTGCDYRIELQDNKIGTSIETPLQCPKCGTPIVAFCPCCRFPLLGHFDMENPRCAVCRQDIRTAFWRQWPRDAHSVSIGFGPSIARMRERNISN
jgi:hypothetical protein